MIFNSVCSNIKDWIKNPFHWNYFTYIFRHIYYQYKLLKRINKHWFPGFWHLSDYMFTSSFEIFCTWYECMKPHEEWINDDKEIQYAKSEIIYLYNWYTKERYEEKENFEWLSDFWWSHNFQGMNMFGNNCYCLYLKNLTRYLLKLVMQEELRLYEKEQENLIRLMKIRRWITD